MKILFVNDDIDFLDLVKRYCQEKGINAETSTNPLIILGTIQATDYDWIIADVKMYPINGVEFLGKVKERVKSKLGLMSGMDEQDLERQARLLGIRDVFPKASAKSFVDTLSLRLS